MIHLYAFVDELDRVPPLRGAAGEPLDAHAFGGVTAVIGELRVALPQTTQSAVAHGVVVESLLEHADAVLPARLAQPFPDRAALVAATIDSLTSLRRRLARVRGCVELGVRVAAPTADAETAADGTSYMRRLAAAASARRAIADQVHALLRPHAVDSRVETARDPATLLRASYLVARNDADEFARRVVRLAEPHPELAVVCTGPWAPYSFVEEAA